MDASFLPLSPLLEKLKEKGVSKESLRKLRKSERPPLDPKFYNLERTRKRAMLASPLDPPWKKLRRENLYRLYLASSSFQYDVVINNTTAVLFFVRPLSFFIATWPGGEVKKVLLLNRREFHNRLHPYKSIFLVRVGTWRNMIMVWLRLSRKQTFESLRRENPFEAEKMQRETPGIRPNSVIGLKVKNLGILFRPPEKWEIVHETLAQDEWYISNTPPIFLLGEVYFSLTRLNLPQRGIAKAF